MLDIRWKQSVQKIRNIGRKMSATEWQGQQTYIVWSSEVMTEFTDINQQPYVTYRVCAKNITWSIFFPGETDESQREHFLVLSGLSLAATFQKFLYSLLWVIIIKSKIMRLEAEWQWVYFLI